MQDLTRVTALILAGGLGTRLRPVVADRPNEKGATSGPGWISAGIYLLKFRLLLTISVGRAVSLESEMFPVWIDQGLYGYRSYGRFLDIGTSEIYAGAETFFSPDRLI